MKRTVNQAWAALCDRAERAAVLTLPNRAADELGLEAGRLTMSPVGEGMADAALTTSFRWDCTAYSKATPERRLHLAPGLIAKAALVRAIVDPTTPEPTAPVSDRDDPRPERRPRLDIDG